MSWIINKLTWSWISFASWVVLNKMFILVMLIVKCKVVLSTNTLYTPLVNGWNLKISSLIENLCLRVDAMTRRADYQLFRTPSWFCSTSSATSDITPKNVTSPQRTGRTLFGWTAIVFIYSLLVHIDGSTYHWLCRIISLELGGFYDNLFL